MTCLLWVAYVLGGLIALVLLFVAYSYYWVYLGKGRLLKAVDDAKDRYEAIVDSPNKRTPAEYRTMLEELERMKVLLDRFEKESWVARIPLMKTSIDARQTQVKIFGDQIRRELGWPV